MTLSLAQSVRSSRFGKSAASRTMTRIGLVTLTSLVCGLPIRTVSAQPENATDQPGKSNARVIDYYGYDDCVELMNADVRVVLCPASGGRVLEYSIGGENVLFLPPGDEGWVAQNDKDRGPMNAGRFDVGPEQLIKRGQVLWSGRWNAELTGAGSARLTSQKDPLSGLQLVRDFSINANGTYLACKQTIHNRSDELVSVCHWSRTFAVGDGIAIVPRSKPARFPNGYVMYTTNRQIQMRPEQASIRVDRDLIVIDGPPEYPKLGFDSYDGWLAYYAPNDLLLIKYYEASPTRNYNEVAGLTASVWYPKRTAEQGKMVEVEPIGPAEHLAPGEQASFTEHWYLRKMKFPSDSRKLTREVVEADMRVVLPKR